MPGLRFSQRWPWRNTPTFRRNISPPFLPAFLFLLVACLAYSSTLKMEVLRPIDTSVDVYQPTRRYNPDDRSLHTQMCPTIDFNTSPRNQPNFVTKFLNILWWYKVSQNMALGPAGLGTKNDCAGEFQQKFTRPYSTGFPGSLREVRYNFTLTFILKSFHFFFFFKIYKMVPPGAVRIQRSAEVWSIFMSQRQQLQITLTTALVLS
jgi:hypothetical protein